MKDDAIRRLEDLHDTPPWDWPEEAVDRIREGLSSATADERQLAATLASAVMDDAFAEELLRLVRNDPDEEVASVSALAFGPALEECSTEYIMEEGEAGDGEDLGPLSRAMYQKVSDALKTVYDDNSRPVLVRRRALEALVRAPQPWQAEATRAAYKSADPDWRITAVFCMGYLDGFDDLILEALHSDDPRVREEAFLSVGSREIEAAGPEVMKVAADEKSPIELRMAAISALETLDPPGSQELLEELANSDNEQLAEVASDVLDEREVWEGEEGEDYDEEDEEEDEEKDYDEEDEDEEEDYEEQEEDEEDEDDGEEDDKPPRQRR